MMNEVVMDHMEAASAIIDLSALQYNLKRFRSQAPHSKVIAIVKANAYGHGLKQIGKQAEQDADALGVARVEEALQLRSSGVVKPILLLEGFYSPADLPILVANNIQTVIHSEDQLIALEEAQLDKPIVVWLKIDTGMHRLGVRPEHVPLFIERLNRCRNVTKPLYYMSHFGCADELDKDITNQQTELFLALTNNASERSLAASAGLLAWPKSHLEWNRAGIIMYGASPFSDSSAQQLGYRPVMTLTAPLIAIRELKAGESVGYGAIWSSTRDTKIGVVAIGYGDGYPRRAPNGTPVWINGRKVPIVGRVSMDMLTVDLGPQAVDRVNDKATLWGDVLPAEEVANHIGVIVYELVTQLTSRVNKIYTYTQST